jgi:hypothetical protein
MGARGAGRDLRHGGQPLGGDRAAAVLAPVCAAAPEMSERVLDLSEILQARILEPFEHFVVLTLDRLVREIGHQRRFDVIAITPDALQPVHEFQSRLLESLESLLIRSVHVVVLRCLVVAYAVSLVARWMLALLVGGRSLARALALPFGAITLGLRAALAVS